MIERWLQITCDNDECGETDNSVAPDMTVRELRADLPASWCRVGSKDACCAECAAAIRAAVSRPSPPSLSPSSDLSRCRR